MGGRRRRGRRRTPPKFNAFSHFYHKTHASRKFPYYIYVSSERVVRGGEGGKGVEVTNPRIFVKQNLRKNLKKYGGVGR